MALLLRGSESEDSKFSAIIWLSCFFHIYPFQHISEEEATLYPKDSIFSCPFNPNSSSPCKYLLPAVNTAEF